MQATLAHQTTSNVQGARLVFANHLYKKFRASCFWYYRSDLVITDENVPLLVKGLRTYGGSEGLKAASELLSLPA